MFVPTPLAHTLIGEPSAPHLALVIHGLLGSRSNWRFFARRLARAAPRWRFITLDLRNHGDSPSGCAPHTLISCAQDVVQLAAELGPPEAIIGHSFGGKVALLAAERLPSLRQAWSLDARVGPVPTPLGPEAQQVSDVLGLLDRAPLNTVRRSDVAAWLQAQGVPLSMARWLATSLRGQPEAWRWAFDLQVTRALLADYFRADLSAWVHTQRQVEVHLVRAGRGSAWTASQLQSYASVARVHTLPRADHWLHVSDPKGLLALMTPAFRAAT